MACSWARPSTEFHGWECSATGGSCEFLPPSSKLCAELFGEGPDAIHNEPDENASDVIPPES